MRHGIGEPKRNEIHYAFLLPMRHAIRSETNICVRIEKATDGQVYQSKKWLRKVKKSWLSKESAVSDPPFFYHGGLETAAPCLQQQLFQLLEPTFEQAQCTLDRRRCSHVHTCRLQRFQRELRPTGTQEIQIHLHTS
jgi:hypothetical protein